MGKPPLTCDFCGKIIKATRIKLTENDSKNLPDKLYFCSRRCVGGHVRGFEGYYGDAVDTKLAQDRAMNLTWQIFQKEAYVADKSSTIDERELAAVVLRLVAMAEREGMDLGRAMLMEIEKRRGPS